MSERLPVELVIRGESFDDRAVRHTVRHLAMRAGWTVVASSPYRLVYLATGAADGADAGAGTLAPVVVPSSPAVGAHLAGADTPIPLTRQADETLVPFPQAGPPRPGWLGGDLIAGAHACLNLWYEQRTQPAATDGWIVYDQDWMARSGLVDPLPLADAWLDRIRTAAVEVGWPDCRAAPRPTVVLTHDVDYLPTAATRGMPRLARAIYRQLVVRKRPADALRLAGRYVRAARRGMPYFDIPATVAEERRRGARSSFQFVVARSHAIDPRYAGGPLPLAALPDEWEVCLHGSYLSARTPDRLATERAQLEAMAGRAVRGHRQHYLNFAPQALFRAVEAAGFGYDMSIGYNDRSGPRAGTYLPFRPYDLDRRRPHAFWELPFVLMDTTLATGYRLDPAAAAAHARAVLEPAIAAGGSAGIIWHQEQCGGLLDPGYERVYLELLDWLAQRGVRSISGGALLPELDAAWNAAASDR